MFTNLKWKQCFDMRWEGASLGGSEDIQSIGGCENKV